MNTSCFADFGIDSLEYPQLLPVIYPKVSGLSLPHSSVSDSLVHHVGQSSAYSSMLLESAGILQIFDDLENLLQIGS